MFQPIIQQFHMMSRSQKLVSFIIIIFILALACYLILYTLGITRIGFSTQTKLIEPAPQQKKFTTAGMAPRTAFDIALPRAREWQSDAILSFLTSQQKTAQRAEYWSIFFTSLHKKDRGFLVEVADQHIISAKEIPYRGSSAEFPSDIMSEEEAIAHVHAIKGYEHEPVLGIEALYGPAEKAWYWGVRTSKGIVTVEAKKK